MFRWGSLAPYVSWFECLKIIITVMLFHGYDLKVHEVKMCNDL